MAQRCHICGQFRKNAFECSRCDVFSYIEEVIAQYSWHRMMVKAYGKDIPKFGSTYDLTNSADKRVRVHFTGDEKVMDLVKSLYVDHPLLS